MDHAGDAAGDRYGRREDIQRMGRAAECVRDRVGGPRVNLSGVVKHFSLSIPVVFAMSAVRAPFGVRTVFAELLEGRHHRRVMTTSRYSEGTTMVASPDLFMRTISAYRSLWRSGCAVASS